MFPKKIYTAGSSAGHRTKTGRVGGGSDMETEGMEKRPGHKKRLCFTAPFLRELAIRDLADKIK